MSLYDDLFSEFNQPIAQVLLTRHDLAEVCILTLSQRGSKKEEKRGKISTFHSVLYIILFSHQYI